MGAADKSVDAILERAKYFPKEQATLRDILSGTRLVETVKWGGPCYTYQDKNVVGISGFKSYFGLWFHQGALLEDKAGKLINAQEGRTKALRQWRMRSAADIEPAIIRRYVKEAMELVDRGEEIGPTRKPSLDVPEELAFALRRTAGAQDAFNKLTPGRQREYAGYIGEAKRVSTRESRTQRVLPMIFAGKGLNDRYR